MPQFDITAFSVQIISLFILFALLYILYAKQLMTKEFYKKFKSYLNLNSTETLYLKNSIYTYFLLGFFIYSWGQLLPGLLLLVCIFAVFLLIFKLPKTRFFGVFGSALIVYVGCISNTYAYDYGLLGHFFSMLVGFCFLLYLNSIGEIQKLGPLKKESLSLYKIYLSFKPFLVLLIYLLFTALIVAFFIYNMEYIVEGVITQPVYIGLLVAIINQLGISVVYICIWSYQDKKHIKSKIKTKVFIFNLSFYKLILFFKKKPTALDDNFIIILNLLSFIKAIPVFLAVFAGLSVRLDSGFSLSVLYFLVMFITCVVCLPTVQTYVMNTYGVNSLRLLGWNGPEVNLYKYCTYGLGVSATYYIGSYANEVKQDFVAVRQLKRENHLHSIQCTYTDDLRLRDPYGYHYQGKYEYPPQPKIRQELKTFVFKGFVEEGPVRVSASYTRSPAEDSLARIGFDPHAKIKIDPKENKK